MRLERFRATGVHGYKSFDVRFNRDLTFLTGINGSGKTTVINAIVALITPDLSGLSAMEFQNLSVTLEHEKRRITISAEGDEDYFRLKGSGTDSDLTVRRYTPDSDVPASRQIDQEAEYFRDLLRQHADNPVLRIIASLPTPMFLGLDRRPRFPADERQRHYYWPPRPSRGVKKTVSTSLTRSLTDAANLAATSNRDALIMSGRIGEELRREMLLNLLTVAPEDYGDLTVPTRREVVELERVRQDLDAFPKIFSLPADDVQRRILPFLDALQSAASAIPSGVNPASLLDSERADPAVTRALFIWSANRAQLKRIRLISDTVSAYNDRRAWVFAPVMKYEKLVNAFLNDSENSITFDEDGYIYISVAGVQETKDVSSLSSGEAQIFIILTQMSFNPAAQAANVFIVDEPELSLHVLWQEIFVDSVMEANPNIQYITATHSPYIILDKTKSCTDVSASGGSSGRSSISSESSKGPRVSQERQKRR